jgi:hypothetical protein
MDLVRDCLDKQLVDHVGKPIGRVDGIVITIDGDDQPRVSAVEVGSVALARRVHEAAGRWMERVAARWGKMQPNPYRLAWSGIEEHHGKYRADVAAGSVPTLEWERWLAKRVLTRIPGS